MTQSAFDHWLDPATRLRTESAKRAHLRAAKQAKDSGASLTWCGMPAPDAMPPWYVVGGRARFELATRKFPEKKR